MKIRARLFRQFRDPAYRHTYVESFVDSSVATQIKVLREQRRLKQSELAERAAMRQSQISSLEDINRSTWKVSTLRKLARAFDLALVVRFESFGGVLPDIEKFGRATLERASFADDPVFSEGVAAPAAVVVGTTTADTAGCVSSKVIGSPERFSVVNRRSPGTAAAFVQDRVDYRVWA
jgi:transcriptional regulator with XRE-family HTH domain